MQELNNEIFALLSTRFSYFKIDHLIKRIGIGCRFVYCFTKLCVYSRDVFGND
ncbi:hypothetical protein P20495_3695 [Pseudoalteromonas sp. BSi20495]|nr:hypothetical protein P20495_3695 [Pseudoalteromonas sp. BSi20495]